MVRGDNWFKLLLQNAIREKEACHLTRLKSLFHANASEDPCVLNKVPDVRWGEGEEGGRQGCRVLTEISSSTPG